MFGFFLSSRRVGFLIPLAVACVTLAGCLADPNPIVQVVPHLVVAPQNVRFQATHYMPGNPPEGYMVVKWNRSIADTQLNFKGYFVKLWKSDTAGYSVNGVDTLTTLLDSVHIVRFGTRIPDTSYPFTSIPGYSGVPMGRYTVVVYGQKTTDTVHYSTDSSEYSANFDPRPLPDPTNLQATSVGPTTVGLHWTPSPMDTSSGFYRYVIYYVDTTKIDTGHVVWTIVKPQGLADTAGWNDSSVTVGVPPFTPMGGTTQEYPYMFWIKSERIDSTFFYGTDTNHIVWSGAESLPNPGGSNDSAAWSGIHNSIFIGSYNQHWAIVDDSNNSDQQVHVAINVNSVTLTSMDSVGCYFLNDGSGGAKMDPATNLDSIYYSHPYADPSQFNVTTAVLPTNPTSEGVVLYLMIPDHNLGGKPEWARLFIKAMPNRTFINTSNGIHVDVSFQPSTSTDGSQHLPFY